MAPTECSIQPTKRVRGQPEPGWWDRIPAFSGWPGGGAPHTLTCSVWMLLGVHLVEVLYDEVAVPKSPFRVGVTEGCDPTRVRAFGPGLEGGLVNKANRFTVETRYPPRFLTLILTLCPP